MEMFTDRKHCSPSIVFFLFVSISITLMLAGCTFLGVDRDRSQVINAIGTVRWINVQNGFYGIVSDDGWKLEPVNLQENFRKDFMRVIFKGRIAPGIVSIHDWGTGVEILRMERLYDDYDSEWKDTGPDPPRKSPKM